MRKILHRKLTKSGLKIFFGWFFILLGILGLFLPILQGLIFLALGATLLAPSMPLFGRVRNWLHHRFPATKRFVRRIKKHFHYHAKKGG